MTDSPTARLDVNGNGGLSLAEVDKAVVELWPAYNHKPALMRAFKAADRDGNGFVTRKEFKKLLHFIGYFNGLWGTFAEMDSDEDHRLDATEFGHAAALVGQPLADDETAAAFAEADVDGGGRVLFDEFCVWCAHRHLGAGFADSDEDDVVSSVRVGLGRSYRFVLPLIHFIPVSLTYSVPVFLKRQCDRTLGPGAAAASHHLPGELHLRGRPGRQPRPLET
jgi:hypothetical protein